MSPDPFVSGPGGGGARLLLGNEAIAQGLFEAGCQVAAAYPGTPSSEVLEALAGYGADGIHLEWSVNEKVAVEVACAASMCGMRSAAVMKQVGLNVALDPVMSLAYTGVVGGMLLVVADDPGPHSSQTEQDTRLFAKAAGLPVLDPSTPEEAREMVHLGYALSERHRLPVILRPLLRVCHSRAPIPAPVARRAGRPAEFVRDVNRWAATPSHRFHLHRELNAKIRLLAQDPDVLSSIRLFAGPREGGSVVVASGTAAAYAADVLKERGGQEKTSLIAIGVPWPLPTEKVAQLSAGRPVLVLEETSPVIEEQLRARSPVSGRGDGLVPSEGELTPDIIAAALDRFLGKDGRVSDKAKTEIQAAGPVAGGQPPVLCAGCPHRASFWALKKAMPKAIYTGDIGCYTLGIALGAVDTVLCMGASISQAAGFSWAHRLSGQDRPVAAVIGDSTFYHAGIPALVNAVHQGAAFVLLILDNAVTAMTGGQPTPGTGRLADGSQGRKVPLEDLVRGCGVERLWTADPLNVSDLLSAIRGASEAASAGQMAVVIGRSPCVLELTDRQGPVPVVDADQCTRCGVCVKAFGCPAIVQDDAGVRIVEDRCPGCGACIAVCPEGAIRAEED